MSFSLKSRQTGDTIVEVIIAVAVVSALLAGAFVVTNRSTHTVQDSQEHAQALQALQGQVELVRAAAAAKMLPNAGTTPSTMTMPFCMGSNLTVYVAGSAACTGASGPVPLNLSVVCPLTSDGCPAAAGHTTTFDLSATWSSLTGNTQTVYLSYKVETP